MIGNVMTEYSTLYNNDIIVKKVRHMDSLSAKTDLVSPLRPQCNADVQVSVTCVD